MKRQIRKLGLPSLALIAMASLFMATPALADYSGSCAAAPATVSGNATIGTAGTACTIPAAGVNATGTITVLGSTISTTGPLTAGGALTITGSSTVSVKALSGASIAVTTPAAITTTTLTSSSGNIDVTSTGAITTTVISSAQHVDLNAQGSTGDAKVTGALTASSGYVQVRAGRLVKITGAVKSVSNGNMLITAQTTLATGAITGAPGYNVDLKANVAGGTSAFVINPASGTPTNGIKGKIAASNGSTVYVTNGSTSSASNITLTTNTDIAVTGTVSNRYIILNANNGTINLPTGTISMDGSGSGSAGQIQLLAQTVAFANNAGLSAKQSLTAPGSLHGIAIAAKTVTYGGTSGLTIAADGNGNNPGSAFVYFAPQGSTTITDGQNINNLFIGVSNNLFGPTNPITYTANSSTSPLTVTANGDNSFIGLYAYPITFTSGGAVTFKAQGTVSHQIYIQNVGTFTGQNGLTLGGVGALTLDATATSGTGGDINIYVDKMPVSASAVTIKTDGPSTGNGNGGTISFYSSALTIPGTAATTISANAASAGTGNASANAIIFYPSGTTAVSLGTGAGKYSLSAKGGSSGGNGGNIAMYAFSNPVTITSAQAVNASAPGATGNGGNIQLTASSFAGTGTGLSITADGGTTSGNGGQIHLIGGGTYSLGGSVNTISLSAQAIGSANQNTNSAGTIEIANAQALTITDSSGVLLGTAGNANGGIVNFHDLAQLTATGIPTIAANGAGTGKGGSITFKQTSLTQMNLSNLELRANGGSTDGAGGTISVTAYQMIVPGARFQAAGKGTGAGGEIDLILTDSSAAIDLSQALVQAPGGVNGTGGTFQVSDTTLLNDPLSIIDVYAEDSGIAAATVSSGLVPPSGPGGKIVNINKAVICQFYWRQLAPDWPYGYWNCAHPTAPSAEDVAPITAALLVPSGNGRTVLSSSTIFVYNTYAVYKALTKDPDPDTGQAGLTYQNAGGTQTYVNIFESTAQFPQLTVTQLEETTGHELGHASDLINADQAGLSTYDAFAQADFKNLDYDRVLNSPQASHRRLPCETSTYDGKPGPFVGVYDESTRSPFCSGTTIEPKYQDPTNSNLPYRNSYIIQTASPYYTLKGFGSPAWKELYSQSFSFVLYVSGLANRADYFVYTLDGVEKNQQFTCAQLWATALENGAVTPPNSSACSTVTAWYTPLLGKKDSHD